jgi:hypothetical protein
MLEHIGGDGSGRRVDLMPGTVTIHHVGVERAGACAEGERINVEMDAPGAGAGVPFRDRTPLGHVDGIDPAFDGQAATGADIETGAGGHPEGCVCGAERECLSHFAGGEAGAVQQLAVVPIGAVQCIALRTPPGDQT